MIADNQVTKELQQEAGGVDHAQWLIMAGDLSTIPAKEHSATAFCFNLAASHAPANQLTFSAPLPHSALASKSNS